MATLEDVLDILVAQAGSRDLDTELKRSRERPWIPSSIRFAASVAEEKPSQNPQAPRRRAAISSPASGLIRALREGLSGSTSVNLPNVMPDC